MESVNNFMYYMFNRWCRNEAHVIYGKVLGEHIFTKYVSYIERGLGELRFYAELDDECKNKLVTRANQVYNNKH
jgi:hypothetical protein